MTIILFSNVDKCIKIFTLTKHNHEEVENLNILETNKETEIVIT